MDSMASLASAGLASVHADSKVAVRSVIGSDSIARLAARLGELTARRRILLLLDGAHAKHQAGDAIGLVDLQHALGELDRLVDLAIGQHRQEGAVEQLAVARIAPQRGAIVGGGRSRVALPARMPGGEIAARRRRARKVCRRPARARTASPAKSRRMRQVWPGRPAGSVAMGSRLVDSIWRTGALGATALIGREWPVWPRPARTALTGHVHRL